LDCSQSDGAAKKFRLSDLSSKAKRRFYAQRFASKKLSNTHVIRFHVILFSALAPSTGSDMEGSLDMYFFSLSLASAWSFDFGTKSIIHPVI